jgi:hypothetical protein
LGIGSVFVFPDSAKMRHYLGIGSVFVFPDSGKMRYATRLDGEEGAYILRLLLVP